MSKKSDIKEAQYLYLPKDRNCEVCLRTKMTRAPCRRRTGDALHRAEKFGDLITADHKVLYEERVNHETITGTVSLYKIFPLTEFNPFRAKQRLHKKRNRVDESPQVATTQSFLNGEFHWSSEKFCEDLPWNHRTSTPYRFETNDIAERAVRRVKEGISAVLSLSGLDENWWADSMECSCYLRNVQDLSANGRTFYERRFGEPLQRPIIPN